MGTASRYNSVLGRAARRLKTTTFTVSARATIAGLVLLGGNSALQTAIAEGDTRTLTFHHLHTHEDITVTFKRNGRYDDAELKKLNWFLRDWRKDEEAQMDPHLFDVVWETYREVGGKEPIQVVSGYRSPDTNAMLRSRSSASGVAEVSQHMAGHALDFQIPGVPLAKIREVGLRLQRGGVGFYPTSGSPFVHLDTGTVRAWPRATYADLQRIFPDGRTVHISSDGRPLPGYAVALAEVERRGNTPNSNSLEAARKAGMIGDTEVAEAANVTTDAKPARSLFASLFGVGNKETNPTSDETTTTASEKRAPRQQVASAAPAKPVATERAVPLPASRPQIAPVVVAAAEPQRPEPATYQTASVDTSFSSRAVWTVGPEPVTTASASQPLAYAAATPVALPQARPMGQSIPAAASEPKRTPVAVTAAAMNLAPPVMYGDQRAEGPWMRAAMLTPSVQEVMTATPLGVHDPRPLSQHFMKPTDALTMTFSADATPALQASRFTGNAVVFLATTNFTPPAKTASLR